MRKDRAARTRTIRGNGDEPPWSLVRRQATRDAKTGNVIEDKSITQDGDSDDRRWIYDLPGCSGLQQIVMEFHYKPSDDGKYPEIKDGQ